MAHRPQLPTSAALICLLYFTKNNNNKVFPLFHKNRFPPSLPTPSPPSAISTGHSLESIFQSIVLPGGMFDTLTPEPLAKLLGQCVSLGNFSGGSSPRSSWLAPGAPSASPEIRQLLGHGEGFDFGGWAQQITLADLRESGARRRQPRNPCSKQEQLCPGEGLSNPLSMCFSSSSVAIHRPRGGSQEPGFYSSSTKPCGEA